MFGKLRKRRSKRNNNCTYFSVAPSDDAEATMEHAIVYDHVCIDEDDDIQEKNANTPDVVTMDQLEYEKKKEEKDEKN